MPCCRWSRLEIDVLFDLIATRMAMTVVISSWRAADILRTGTTFCATISRGLGAAERGRGLSRDEAVQQIIAHAMWSHEMSAADEAISTRDMIARRSRCSARPTGCSTTSPSSSSAARASGSTMPAGHRYLDAYNNVASVGHCHPHVVRAIARQAAVLNTHTRYLHETVLDYAEKLLGTFPAEIGHVMFTCTGSEANDLACASREPAPAAPASSSPKRLSRRHQSRWPSCLPRSDCRFRRIATCGSCRRRVQPATTPAKSLRVTSAWRSTI